MTLVKVHFHLEQDADGYPPVAVESVWTKPGTNSGEYIIDNVPFFIRDATIGDTIIVHEEGDGLWFDRLISRSENSLMRVTFFDRSCVDPVGERLVAMGCSIEYLRNHNLMSVSIPVAVRLADIQAYLQSEANMQRIDFEEPILRQSL